MNNYSIHLMEGLKFYKFFKHILQDLKSNIVITSGIHNYELFQGELFNIFLITGMGKSSRPKSREKVHSWISSSTGT